MSRFVVVENVSTGTDYVFCERHWQQFTDVRNDIPRGPARRVLDVFVERRRVDDAPIPCRDCQNGY